MNDIQIQNTFLKKIKTIKNDINDCAKYALEVTTFTNCSDVMRALAELNYYLKELEKAVLSGRY